MKVGRILEADVLVIGTGAAGLRAAIEARRYGADVLVVDKALIGVSNNSAFSGGGIKAALPGLDASTKKQYRTPGEHTVETIRSGFYLNNQRLVEILAVEAPARLLELREFGVDNFENMQLYNVNAKSGMSRLTKPMVETCKKWGSRLHPRIVIYDFLVEGGAIRGAVAFDCLKGTRKAIRTGAIIVATGGAGEVYLRNDTVRQTTGEAYAIAFRAGAELIGMELIQFDPHL